MTVLGRTDPRPDTDWHHHAACATEPKETFFPGLGDVATMARAKAICATCPVQARCLEEALDGPGFGDHGVWGGTSGAERRRIRARRRRSAA